MENIKTLFVGMDISLYGFNIEYLDIDSNSYSSKKNKYFLNNPTGLNSFIDELYFIALKNNFTKIKIGFEATNNYGFHLPFYLSESPLLKKIKLDIYQINPKIIKNARKSYSEIPKTDYYDAYVIAERLKNGKLPPYTRFDPHYLALRFLTRARFDIIKKLVSLKSRFISMLFIKASSFTQNKIFSNTLGNTSLNLLTFFDSTETIANLDINELVSFIIKYSKNHFKHPEKIAEKIKYIARESYTLNRIMHDSISYSLLTLFNQIKFLTRELKQTDKQIEKTIVTFKNDFDILNSIKGIGKVFAAGIIAELGDLSDFTSQCAIAKFSGLMWRIRQSSKYKSEETELTKTGNKYLRYYLVEAAQSVVTHNPDFQPYYQKKYNESTKHKHKRAILFVARKLIRVIYSLLKNNKLYQTPNYISNYYCTLAIKPDLYMSKSI
jgi:transposase